METQKLYFESTAVLKDNSRGWLIAPSANEVIEVATPSEFPDGVEGPWSPEALLLGAVSSCFMTTFLSLAKRKKLAYSKFRCHAEGVVEFVNGKYQFTELHLFPELQLPENGQQLFAEEVLMKTKKYCMVGNALKLPMNVHTKISTEEKFALN